MLRGRRLYNRGHRSRGPNVIADRRAWLPRVAITNSICQISGPDIKTQGQYVCGYHCLFAEMSEDGTPNVRQGNKKIISRRNIKLGVR